MDIFRTCYILCMLKKHFFFISFWTTNFFLAAIFLKHFWRLPLLANIGLIFYVTREYHILNSHSAKFKTQNWTYPKHRLYYSKSQILRLFISMCRQIPSLLTLWRKKILLWASSHCLYQFHQHSLENSQAPIHIQWRFETWLQVFLIICLLLS